MCMCNRHVINLLHNIAVYEPINLLLRNRPTLLAYPYSCKCSFFYLTRLANMPEGLYVLLALISFLCSLWDQLSEESTGPTFTIFFSPNDRHLFVDDRSGPLFPISQGMYVCKFDQDGSTNNRNYDGTVTTALFGRDGKNRHNPPNISTTIQPILPNYHL